MNQSGGGIVSREKSSFYSTSNGKNKSCIEVEGGNQINTLCNLSAENRCAANEIMMNSD